MSLDNHKITTYEDNVADLPDYPSDAGYTAKQIKEIFDGRGDKEIKEKFNALIDELAMMFTEMHKADGAAEKNAKGYADTAIFGHNTEEGSHADIRFLIEELTRRLNTLADSEDITPTLAEQLRVEIDRMIEDIAEMKVISEETKQAIEDMTGTTAPLVETRDYYETNNPKIPDGQFAIVKEPVEYKGVSSENISVKVGEGDVFENTDYIANIKAGTGFGSIVQIDAVNEKDAKNGKVSGETGHSTASVASGENSAAFGRYNLASGKTAVVFGYDNEASGDRSSAFGAGNIADGIVSLATGYKTRACGNHSATFGSGTKTNSQQLTDPSLDNAGNCAMAIGSHSIANGSNSFSGGYSSVTEGIDAFAFGSQSTASGNGAVAFGSQSTASGECSIVVGKHSTTAGECAIALGSQVNAKGDRSFALGNKTSASGHASIAGGDEAATREYCAISLGRKTQANGIASVALGSDNIADGNWSQVGGTCSTALLPCSFAFGYFVTSGVEGVTLEDPYPQVVLGKYNSPNTTAAFQIGWGTSLSDRKNVFEIDIDSNNNPIYRFGNVSFTEGELTKLKSLLSLTNGDEVSY